MKMIAAAPSLPLGRPNSSLSTLPPTKLFAAPSYQNPAIFPHALELDTAQGIAYTDCTEVDPDVPLVQHIVRMDLKTMKAFPDDPFQTMLAPDPSMMVLDHPQQLLFVACAGGITVFDVRPGHFRKLGNYVIGHSTTSIIVDQSTQFIYLPVASAGGRPVLQIARYNPNGA